MSNTVTNCFQSMIIASIVLSGYASAQPTAGGSDEQQKSTYSYDIEDQCYYTSACYSVQVGSAAIDSSRIAPYHATWIQSSMKDGKFVTSSTSFEESLNRDASGNWIHVQTVLLDNGTATVGTRTLDGETLQALKLAIVLKNMPTNQPSRIVYDLTGKSFAADVVFADGRNEIGDPRDLAMPMFDGQIAGLTIAALPLVEGFVATMPVVIPNLGIYWLEAEVVGKALVEISDSERLETWEVTANWLNLTDGDIYEPGRDGDGGVYYIATNSGNGVPPVIEYAVSGTVIRWDGIRRQIK